MPPNKLKAGYGEGVCTVLYALCDISIKNKVKFRKPVIKDEGGGFGDDEGDEFGEDFEGNADIADMQRDAVQSDGDDIDDELEFGNLPADQPVIDQDDLLQQQIIQSSISREEWMLEVERVAHKLKVNKVGADGKEWRSHMDQTKKFHDQVKANLPDVRFKLEKLSEEVSKALEKIGKKEQVLTRSF